VIQFIPSKLPGKHTVFDSNIHNNIHFNHNNPQPCVLKDAIFAPVQSTQVME